MGRRRTGSGMTDELTLLLERDASEWRISRFRFTLKFIDGNRELERPES